jgi:crotonobetainyl-CoA hydratase
MEAILTGQPIPAGQALAWGLVNRVVPAAELLTSAFELADRICANAPLAVQASKRIARGIDDARVSAEDDDWARSTAEGARLMKSADAMEGMRAFAEKRAPHWQGR